MALQWASFGGLLPEAKHPDLKWGPALSSPGIQVWNLEAREFYQRGSDRS